MKMQLPPIGGIRKVLKTNAQSGGTTIAEIGNGTVTLEQLAALIFNLLTNTGTVNTAAAAPGVLVPGAGLGGGGVLTGSVPIYLTAPIPALLAEDGQDGDVGPPGPRGAQGAQGIPGAFLLAEDGADGDIGPPGIQGVMGSQGPQGIPGTSGTGSSTGLVVFVPEDPSDNDAGFFVPGPVGPAGPQGATGATGSAGTGSGGTAGLQIYIPEDPYWEDEIYRGPTNGPQIINGPLNIMASAVIGTSVGILSPAAIYLLGGGSFINAYGTSALLSINSSGSINLDISGSVHFTLTNQGQIQLQNVNAGTAQLSVVGANSAGQSEGILVQAGTNNSDYVMRCINAAGTSQLFEIYGDGGVTVGTAAGVADKGTGTLNAQLGLYVAGIPVTQVGMAVPGDRLQMIPEDPYWEDEIFRGPPSVVGYLSIQGLTNMVAPSGATVIANYAGTNVNGAFFQIVDYANGANRGYIGFGSNMFTGGAIGDFGMSGQGNTILGYNGGANKGLAITATGSVLGSGATAAALVDMTPDTGTFTATGTGFTTGPTGTAVWYRIGKIAMLFLPVLSSTSNASSFTVTGLPAVIQPTRTQFLDVPQSVVENSGADVGTVSMSVTNSGTITFYLSGNSSGFTGTGAKGIVSGFTVSYLLN